MNIFESIPSKTFEKTCWGIVGTCVLMFLVQIKGCCGPKTDQKRSYNYPKMLPNGPPTPIPSVSKSLLPVGKTNSRKQVFDIVPYCLLKKY